MLAHLRVADNAGIDVVNVNSMTSPKTGKNSHNNWQPLWHFPSLANDLQLEIGYWRVKIFYRS